jgi:hypothetical protein
VSEALHLLDDRLSDVRVSVANVRDMVPTEADTAAFLRSMSSCDFGPGMAVTRRRSCGSDGPPTTAGPAAVMLMTVSSRNA